MKGKNDNIGPSKVIAGGGGVEKRGVKKETKKQRVDKQTPFRKTIVSGQN